MYNRLHLRESEYSHDIIPSRVTKSPTEKKTSSTISIYRETACVEVIEKNKMYAAVLHILNKHGWKKKD